MVAEKRLPRSFSGCVIKPSSQDKTPIGRDFQVALMFENGFPYPVKVVLSSGFAVTLPPHGNVGINNVLSQRVYNFVVRKQFKYSSHVKIDTNNVLSDVPEDNKELYAMVLAANQANSNYGYQYHDFSIDYCISRDQFEAHAKTGLYVPEIDAVICLADDCDVVHPNSPDGLSMQANESGDLLGYSFRLEIVDPYDQFGHRFININGVVDRIEPIKDVRREPGVYLHRVMRETSGKTADIETKHFSFDEAIKALRLFRTEDEAKSLGDILEAQKRDYELRAQENKNRSLELESKLREETAKSKQAALDYEAKEAELKEVREVLKALREERVTKLKEDYEKRSMAREDYYDQRSSARKDDGEWLKWVPAVIVGGGLLAYKLFWD